LSVQLDPQISDEMRRHEFPGRLITAPTGFHRVVNQQPNQCLVALGLGANFYAGQAVFSPVSGGKQCILLRITYVLFINLHEQGC
jgi:hypothetical protein